VELQPGNVVQMFPVAPVTQNAVTEIALVDLSSIAYPIWHMSSGQPNPDYVSQAIVDRVRALTAAHPKAAICCDKGKSFRAQISDSYKANRPQQEAALHHQIRIARERLEADGYPVWAVPGFEADDLIGTACRQAIACGVDVLVISADKDLLQLVGPRVRVLSPKTNQAYDVEAVKAKFGILPAQVRDYLMLVGDASDNVKGAPGIGPKKAADLLHKYGDIAGIYTALREHGTQFTPSMATALREFEPRLEEVRQLVTLRTDVDLPFAELDNDRAAKAAPLEDIDMSEAVTPEVVEQPSGNGSAPAVSPFVQQQIVAGIEAQAMIGKAAEIKHVAPALNLATSEPALPAPVEFEKQLEPRSLGQAHQLAKAMFGARMFNGYGSPEGVLSTVLAGRELGMQAVASLRAFHVIEGKHALAADAMRGLVLRSGAAEYFRVVKRTPEIAEFETKRKGEPEPVRLAYTIAEARAAYGLDGPERDGSDAGRKAYAELERKWARSSWGKHPAAMLAARASSQLARLVYADILYGLYCPAELDDNRAE
jgi:5'-3' exonuclease